MTALDFDRSSHPRGTFQSSRSETPVGSEEQTPEMSETLDHGARNIGRTSHPARKVRVYSQ